MSKGKRKSKRKLFDPDEISTLISQAITRDLGASSHVYEDPNDPLAYARFRQRTELLKKYVSPKLDRAALEQKTYRKFLDVNAHMHETNRKLRNTLPWDRTYIQSSDAFETKVHLRARALMHEVLSPLDFEDWFELCKNSSGSSIGVPYVDTSNEAKFSYPLTVTEGCLPYWDDYCAWNKQLHVAIQYWNALCPSGPAVQTVRGSRASTVDKNLDILRFINIEPTLNMFFQQGLMAGMYIRMKEFGLDVESLPDTNRTLAWLSSIVCKDDTVDWSSASDCSSIVLSEWLLPSQWYERVVNTRSPVVDLNGDWVELGMISTMGNAVTFPLETLVFWTYAHAVHYTLTHPRDNRMFELFEKRPRLNVFGDDCVVPSFMTSIYIGQMTDIGFICNTDKSCIGPRRFRESCGGDYLVGSPVRPFHLKAPQSERLSALEPWLHIILNRLIPRYIRYFGRLGYVYDKELFRVIADLYRRYDFKLKVVPSFLPEDAGLHIGDDLVRLVRNYGFKLSPIARSHQGTVTYQYKRFVYRESRMVSLDIRYNLWLNKPVVATTWDPTRGLDDIYHRREIGGYVVATGVTAHWTVPDVSRVALS